MKGKETDGLIERKIEQIIINVSEDDETEADEFFNNDTDSQDSDIRENLMCMQRLYYLVLLQ